MKDELALEDIYCLGDPLEVPDYCLLLLLLQISKKKERGKKPSKQPKRTIYFLKEDWRGGVFHRYLALCS